MEHAYLTKKEIEKAVEMKQITSSERQELIDILEYYSRPESRSKKHLVFNSEVVQNSLHHFV